MRKLLLSGIIFGLVLCSCAKDATSEVTPTIIVKHNFTIQASMPVTRTQLASDGYNVLWSQGDQIGLFVKSGDTFTTLNAPMTYTGSSPAAAGVFTGDITLTEGATSYTFYAYYPYSASAGSDPTAVAFTLAENQTQAASNDSTHLGDYDFLVAQSVATTSMTAVPSFTFNHAFAVVEIDLTGSGDMAGKSVASVGIYGSGASQMQSSGELTNTVNMSGSFTFDLTADSNTVATYSLGTAVIDYCTVSLTEQPVLSSTTQKIYAIINSTDYSQNGGAVYVTTRTTDGYVSTATYNGIAIAAADMKVITQDVSSGTATTAAVDLSASETANCYIANTPNQKYTFNASVAGNGAISSGLLQAVQQYEGRTLSAALTGGTTARLIWQDAPDLIYADSVTYSNGVISFRLTDRPTAIGGNAVIGLFANDNSNAEAIWSWHIWITDQSNADLLAAAQTYTLNSAYASDFAAGSTDVMDRNLGAVYNAAGAYSLSQQAPLYQWGRKDPLPWGSTLFDADNTPHDYLTYIASVTTTGSTGQYVGYTGNSYYATAHPLTFISSSSASAYDWYYGGGSGDDARNDYLWGNPQGATSGQTTTKTLFDPCPAGWKMPHGYTYTGFTKTGGAIANLDNANVNSSFNEGWNFVYSGSLSTYYPCVGSRNDEYAMFTYYSTGRYWTSAPSASVAAQAISLSFSSASIDPQLANARGLAMPVRCVKE